MTSREPLVEGTLRPWLGAVAEITRRVNTGRPDRDLFDLIAVRAAGLTGQDFVAVQMRDEAAGRLLIVGSSGLDPAYVSAVNGERPIGLRPGDRFYDSPSSRAFRLHRSVLIPDIDEQATFGPWRDLAREQGYRAMLAVPMIAAGKAIGVLACYGRRPGSLGAADVAGAELMAEQAALALHTAELRHREAKANTRLRETNRHLDEHRARLEEAERTHRYLMDVVLAGESLPDITHHLAEALAAPVTAEIDTPGPGPDLVTAATGGHRAPVPPSATDPAVAAALDTLLTHRTATPVHPAGPAPADPASAGPASTAAAAALWVAPITAGSEILGRLWVRPAGPLSPLDRRTLEWGAVAIATELLRRRAALEERLRLSRDVLTDLLLGQGADDPDDLRARAARLGHDLTVPHRLLLASATRQAVPQAPVERLVTAAVTVTDGIRPRPLTGLHHGAAVLLLPAASASSRTAHDIARQWHAALPGAPAIVVIGDNVTDPATCPGHFATARGALRLARTARVIDLADLGIHTLLLRSCDPDALAEHARATLGPLKEYDRRRGTVLLDTLRAWLHHAGRTGDIGEALVVHPNTVRDRIHRVQRILGVDLSDRDVLLTLHYAVTIDALLEP